MEINRKRISMMLGKTNDTETEKSVISSDMKIKGKISADGDLVLLGSVVGDIKCHSLSVEDTGTLKGNIDADVVTVSGKCDGPTFKGYGIERCSELFEQNRTSCPSERRVEASET